MLSMLPSSKQCLLVPLINPNRTTANLDSYSWPCSDSRLLGFRLFSLLFLLRPIGLSWRLGLVLGLHLALMLGASRSGTGSSRRFLPRILRRDAGAGCPDWDGGWCIISLQ